MSSTTTTTTTTSSNIILSRLLTELSSPHDITFNSLVSEEIRFYSLDINIELYTILSTYILNPNKLVEIDNINIYINKLIDTKNSIYLKFIYQFIPVFIWSYYNRSIYHFHAPILYTILLKLKSFYIQTNKFILPDISKPSIYSQGIDNFKPFDDTIWYKKSEQNNPTNSIVSNDLTDISSVIAFQTIQTLLKIYNHHSSTFSKYSHESYLKLVRNLTCPRLELSINNTITWGKIMSNIQTVHNGNSGNLIDYLQTLYTPTFNETENDINYLHRFVLDSSILNLLVDGIIVTISYIGYEDPLSFEAVKMLNLRGREKMEDKVVMITDQILSQLTIGVTKA